MNFCCSNKKAFEITYNIGHGQEDTFQVCIKCYNKHSVFSQSVKKSTKLEN